MVTVGQRCLTRIIMQTTNGCFSANLSQLHSSEDIQRRICTGFSFFLIIGFPNEQQHLDLFCLPFGKQLKTMILSLLNKRPPQLTVSLQESGAKVLPSPLYYQIPFLAHSYSWEMSANCLKTSLSHSQPQIADIEQALLAQVT